MGKNLLIRILGFGVVLLGLNRSAPAQKYQDGRPEAQLRMNARDHGIVLRYGDGPDQCDILGARDVWVFESNGTYYMHYDAAGPEGWLSSLAVSKDLVHWEKKGPILDFGKAGEDDAASASYGVTFYDDTGWHMFYLGTPNASDPPDLVPSFPYLTMKAKGAGPEGPWIKQKDVVPFRTQPGSYYSVTASPGHVIKKDNEYLQFFSSTTRIKESRYVQRTLGIARSSDLDASWSVDPVPLVPVREQIENSSLYYEESNKTWFLFTNHIGVEEGREYTDAIWVYWSRDLNNWDPKNKAIVLDGENCSWSEKCIGLPSVLKVGQRLALFYDAPGGTSTSHMKRNVGLAWLDLPLSPPGQSSTQKEGPPNIIFILVDQWRGSAFGYAGDANVRTPHLDALASKGVSFTNAVSVCPVCTPYRASLLTGRYPTSTGMFLNDLYLPEEELTLAEIFKANDYSTAYFGKWHLDGHGRQDFTPPERRQGFDFWMALECSHDYSNMPYYDNDSPEMRIWDGYSPFALSLASQEYMARQRDSGKPFFLFLSIASPHFPHHTALKEYQEMYPVESIQVNPNVPEDLHGQVKEELRGYYAHCTATDQAIGDLLNKMEELELMENTIVVFTSDHGEIMGAHGIPPTQKQVPYRESASVPLLIHYPGTDDNSRRIEMPLSTPDISATLLSLAGVNIPESFEGRDYSDIVKGGGEIQDHAALYMCVSSFARVQPQFKKEYRAIKTNRYSYVKDISGAWLLFDDRADPYQMNNLAGLPEFADIQKQLDKLLMQELQRINDDFRPAASYLQQWGYEVQENGHIAYQQHGQEKVQSPKSK